jgi:hypothetical protein
MGKKAISHDIKQRIIGLNMGGHSNIEISRILKSICKKCIKICVALVSVLCRICVMPNLRFLAVL